MNQAIDVLTVFVYLFHIPSCTVSLFGVGWSMLKQYSIITLLPVLNNEERLVCVCVCGDRERGGRERGEVTERERGVCTIMKGQHVFVHVYCMVTEN